MLVRRVFDAAKWSRWRYPNLIGIWMIYAARRATKAGPGNARSRIASRLLRRVNLTQRRCIYSSLLISYSASAPAVSTVFSVVGDTFGTPPSLNPCFPSRCLSTRIGRVVLDIGPWPAPGWWMMKKASSPILNFHCQPKLAECNCLDSFRRLLPAAFPAGGSPLSITQPNRRRYPITARKMIVFRLLRRTHFPP